MINDPVVRPRIRAPRLQILLDGEPLLGAIEASWHQTNHYAADTWSATFAFNASPQRGVAWWDKRTDPLVLDIQVGMEQPNGAVQWLSLGIGQVDDHRIDLVRGEIHLDGRDLSCLLLDAETSEIFQNKTSSEIVTAIATRHGLTADVTATTELASRFLDQDHTLGSCAQGGTTKEWDLLVRLARAEGFDIYVTGRTLHFHPVADLSADPWVIRYDPPTASARTPISNAIDLMLTRRFSLAKSVTVVVKSFSSKSGTKVTSTKRFIGAGATGGQVGGQVFTTPGKKATTYTFVRPNLTQAQADKLAQSMLDDITRHERTVTFRCPADPILSARSVIRVEGTTTDFDAAFYVETVTRQISVGGGFVMDVSAKNHSNEASDAAAN